MSGRGHGTASILPPPRSTSIIGVLTPYAGMKEDKTKISFEDPPGKRQKQAQAELEAYLIVIQGASVGKKFNLDKDELIIGRSEDADIRVDEDNVSRVHAKVCVNKGGTIQIVDQNSTNGTFVNTKRQKSATLEHGDMILLGNTILKFVSGDNAESAYHEEIYRLATLDGMTQIYNKKYLLEQLQNEFSRCRRYRRDLSLVMFDLDHFKSVNDVHGHQAGDFVLRKISTLVARNLRKEDIFGRYGGEEFVIVLPETDGRKSGTLADKIRKLVAATEFAYNGKVLPVTISVGVTSFTPGTNQVKQYADLIEQADIALYKVKNSGRNRVSHYHLGDV